MTDQDYEYALKAHGPFGIVGKMVAEGKDEAYIKGFFDADPSRFYTYVVDRLIQRIKLCSLLDYSLSELRGMTIKRLFDINDNELVPAIKAWREKYMCEDGIIRTDGKVTHNG